MGTATTMQRPRLATPERWQAALSRALSNGVEVRQLAGSGQWIATSSSRPSVAYGTNGIECECEAAMLGGDPVCQHRAASWHALGVLDLDPEPETPTPAAPALVPCDACDARGWAWAGAGLETPQFRVTCAICRGAGEVEAGDEDYAPTPAELAAHEAPYGPAPVPADCAHCSGHGLDPACTGHGTAAGRIVCECPACDGSGRSGRAPREEVPTPLAA